MTSTSSHCRRRIASTLSTTGLPRKESRPLSRPPTRRPSPPARMTPRVRGAAAIPSPCVSVAGGIRPVSDLTGGSRPALLSYVADHPPPLALLAFGERVAATGERILAFAELDADRRAFQLVALAEEIFQVTTIAVGDVLGTRAVDHDRGRIVSARMRKAQLGRMSAHQRRLVRSQCFFQRTRQVRRAELARSRKVRAIHAAHQFAQA